MTRRTKPSFLTVSPKKYLLKKKYLMAFIFLCILFLTLFLWKEWAEKNARWTPSYPIEVISPFDTVASLSQAQLDFIQAQTGLSAIGLGRLEESGTLNRLEEFQQAFFTPALELSKKELTSDNITELLEESSVFPMTCFQNSPISWEEYLLDSQGDRGYLQPLVPLELGDILLTPNSHCFGWRQGHAGLVVDAQQAITLESVVLGANSVTQWASKWQSYPAGVILRPVNSDLGEIAVSLALEYLADIPYNLTVGIFTSKNQSTEEITSTHCAHLVWQAYRWAGIDLDSNGGQIITPQNLVASPQLEIVQVWGLDPLLLW